MAFRLIIITAPGPVRNEVATIHRLFEAGLKVLHVRKPEFSRSELHSLIAQIDKKYHRRLVLHSHYSLAKEFNVKGLHLTEKTRKDKVPSSFNPVHHTLSASFHSLRDIDRNRRKYDYIFLSPVFDSISKRGYRGSLNFDELSKFLRTHRNVAALGGVEPRTIPQLRKMGFKAAAVLGFIWTSDSPARAFRKLRSKIE